MYCVVMAVVVMATVTAAASSRTPVVRRVVGPIAEDCINRPKLWRGGHHMYFFSTHLDEYYTENGTEILFNWIDARNECRRRCMDLVSIESITEWKMIEFLMDVLSMRRIWTSGRLCDFMGCENRPDLLPLNENGWFWSATFGRINTTDGEWPWSNTGYLLGVQPDDAESKISGVPESCMAVLTDEYEADGAKWHDVACYHKMPFLCEDSDELLHHVDQQLGIIID